MKRSYLASVFCLSDFGCRKIRSLGGCGFLLIGLFYFCGREFFGEIFFQFQPFWKWALKRSAKTIFLSCDILICKITFLPPISHTFNRKDKCGQLRSNWLLTMSKVVNADTSAILPLQYRA